MALAPLLLTAHQNPDLAWPMFRGPGASGVSPGGRPPRLWSVRTRRNIEWELSIPGLGLSSPVVWGDQVFVTTALASQPEKPLRITGETLAGSVDVRPLAADGIHEWWVYSVNVKSGAMMWRKLLHRGVPKSRRHEQNSFATPTPAVNGRHLVVLYPEGLHCLDLFGRLHWSSDLGDLRTGSYLDRAHEWGYASSPIISGRLVIVQADVFRNPFLAAFDIDTGKEVWRTPREDLPSWSTPVVQDAWGEPQVITLAPLHVNGYRLSTGERIWRLYWGMDITQSTPVVASDYVFVASGKGRHRPVMALRGSPVGDITLQLGERSNRWVVWSETGGGPITTTPIAYRGYLYALTDLGVLRCFKADTGELVYRRRIAGAAFQASPVAADGRLYLASVEGAVYVIHAGPEFQMLAVNEMDTTVQATPAISGDRLLIRTREKLYSIRELPGTQANSGSDQDSSTTEGRQ